MFFDDIFSNVVAPVTNLFGGASSVAPAPPAPPVTLDFGLEHDAPTPPVDATDPTLPADKLGAPLGRGAALGRYVVLDFLGQGGMGTVYAAYDAEIDRRIAVKLLRGEAAQGPASDTARARLLREAQAMARLRHPNVAAVYDVGTFGDQVFIAMEFVDGVTLRDWLNEKLRPWRDILSVFLPAGRALVAAHAAGVVHRDFKPDNVMVDRDGRVCVLDFGLARAVDGPADPDAPPSVDPPRPGSLSTPLTRTGALVGTPAYMAPERFSGVSADVGADQYAFCVALYEALYRERPYDGQTVAELKAAFAAGAVRPPPAGTTVPAWLRDVLVRGLRADPASRFPSMSALLAALENDPSASRRRRLGWSLAVVVMAGAGVGGWALYARSRAVCRVAEGQLAGIWDPGRQAAVKAALLATGDPFANDAWRGVSAAFDDYAKRWAAMNVEACEATRVRGEQTEGQLDVRMECLADRRNDLRARVELLAAADAKLAGRAIQLARSLPPIDRCAKMLALRSAIPPPADASSRRRIQAVKEKLAEAESRIAAGRLREALPVAREAVEAARAAGWRPIESQALFMLGRVQLETQDAKTARATLIDAMVAADASRAEGPAAEIRILLIQVEHDLRDFDQALLWAKQASAAMERMGGDQVLEGELANNLGNVAAAQGQREEAVTHYRRALELWEQGYGPKHPFVAIALNNLGSVLSELRRYDEAATALERSLAIYEELYGPESARLANPLLNIGNVYQERGSYQIAADHYQRSLRVREKALGPDHPRVGDAVSNLGESLRCLGKTTEALAAFERAVAIFEKALGPDDPILAYPLTGLGRVELDLRAPALALPPLERALRLRESATDPAEVGETKLALAQALWDTGGDKARARALASAALDEYAKVEAISGRKVKDDIAAARSWVARHP